MTTTPEERGRFIVKVLDTALSGVFPSEDEIGALAPHVDQINKRYGEMRGKSFREASIASRAEFIAQSIREAEDAALERARQLVLEGHDEAWGNPAEQAGWDQAAARIRALKSKG